MPYSSYITAVQGVYAGLNAANFPGGERTPGPFLDEPPTDMGDGDTLRPPYVILHDLGSDYKWTFTSDVNNIPAQNGLVIGGFFLECYALEMGDADNILAAILWNGQIPNNRAGLAFATLDLTLPWKGVAGAVVPTRDQRQYAGFEYQNNRVHVVKQWFKITTAIPGSV